LPDRHRIWRIVANNRQAMQDGAPEGYEAVVDVFFADRAEPVRLNEVQTSRDENFPWVLLMEGKGPDRARNDRVVFAPEQYVSRIEIHYERSGERQTGFSVEALDEPPEEG
jgi:hypothetical protein